MPARQKRSMQLLILAGLIAVAAWGIEASSTRALITRHAIRTQPLAVAALPSAANDSDLTGFFWTKRIVRNSLGKEECHAEEEVQCGADRDAAASG